MRLKCGRLPNPIKPCVILFHCFTSYEGKMKACNLQVKRNEPTIKITKVYIGATMGVSNGSYKKAKQANQARQERQGDLISFAARRPLAGSGASNTIVSSTGNPVKPSQISFDRKELSAILRIYGFKVAEGDWRDYAIDHLKDRAVFSVFRKSGEVALYTIEKNPKLARRQGAYSVIGANNVVLKRGRELAQVLRIFEKQLKLVE